MNVLARQGQRDDFQSRKEAILGALKQAPDRQLSREMLQGQLPHMPSDTLGFTLRMLRDSGDVAYEQERGIIRAA